MRSTSGQHFIALDHLRALAAFLVFSWHFMHSSSGAPVTFEGSPRVFIFALVDEGHTGVALFMTLSGYLFAKLLNGQTIHYSAFLWNRFIRLAPLLAVMFFLVWLQQTLQGRVDPEYFHSLVRGFIFSTWPNGAWSITTELHFYLVLPLLLLLLRRSARLLLLVIACALAFRGYFYLSQGEVQSIAYWTILGRIDQFVLGILAFHFAPKIAKQTIMVWIAILTFLLFWWWFDKTGGFYLRPSYPSPSSIWIVLPMIEGLAYALLIAWYDGQKVSQTSIASKIAQRIGEYSYSIYLLHFFVVFQMAGFVHNKIMNISNFYLALAWSVVCFLLMMIPGFISYQLIEKPFLRFRRNYMQYKP